MKRFMLAASFTLVAAAPATASIGQAVHRTRCPQLFTPAMGERAARAVYRGTHHVTPANLRLLGYIERCQRNPRMQARVRAYDRHQDALHKAQLRPPLAYAVASWYDDAGNTACGFHAGMGVANRTLPCGTHVTFYYAGRSVDAEVDDRGPFVGGRDWDLNQTAAGALGFAGVATVGYIIR